MTKLMIIAEAGVNHNGDVARAVDLVYAAAEADADYVKFQAFTSDQLVAGGAKTAVYQAKNTGVSDQGDLLRSLELSPDEFARIADACRSAGIGFMATAFDTDKIDYLVSLGMDRLKIASGELTNAPALEKFASFHLPILLSTGMSTLCEVREALEILDRAGADDVTVLHCTSLYPAPYDTLNLLAIRTLSEAFGLPVGFSDHSLGDHAVMAAVALGASVIEKHFTLDRGLPGPDHRASLEPGELTRMVSRLREVEIALGDGVKAPSADEIETAALVRRSWHTSRALSAGSVIELNDVVLKRPANGLQPALSPVGARLVRDLDADAPIRDDDIEI